MTAFMFIKPYSLQGPSRITEGSNPQTGSSRSPAVTLGEILSLNIQLNIAMTRAEALGHLRTEATTHLKGVLP